MRVIGHYVPGLPAALPSAKALREAAIHQTTAAALASLATTGVPHGIHRFVSHADMNRHVDEAHALAVAMNVQQRSSRK